MHCATPRFVATRINDASRAISRARSPLDVAKRLQHSRERMKRRVLGMSSLIVAAALLSTGPAPAQTHARGERRPLAWRDEWRKATALDTVLAVVGVTGTVLTGFVLGEAPARFEGRNPLDEEVRGAIRVPAPGSRQTMTIVSDALFYGVAVYPLIVDAGIVTWGIHGEPGTAARLAVSDLSSLGTAGTIAGVIEHVGRERPYRRNCAPGPDRDFYCDDSGPNTSFLSGHTTAAFTGAGLICVQHKMLPLYGSRGADNAACAAGLTLASFSGILRLTGDQHYFTDVLAGSALGLAAGYVLPSIIHFGFGPRPPIAVHTTGTNVFVRGAF